MVDYFMLILIENDIVPENLQGIKRRRWLDKSTGKSYSRDWNLVASGTRITADFGAFLKELSWYSCREHQERCRVYTFEGKYPK